MAGRFKAADRLRCLISEFEATFFIGFIRVPPPNSMAVAVTARKTARLWGDGSSKADLAVPSAETSESGQVSGANRYVS